MKLSYGFTRPLPIPLKDFVVDWLPQIDCEPIDQRLEVDNGTSKREGIINHPRWYRYRINYDR